MSRPELCSDTRPSEKPLRKEVTEADLGGRAASLSPTDLELELNILRRAVQFAEQGTHKAAVQSTMQAFSQKLEAAGFAPDGEAEVQADVMGAFGVYSVWAQRKWRHPDTDNRIEVDLCAEVRARSERGGEVTVTLEMSDEHHGDDAVGVLHDHTFAECVTLQPGFQVTEAAVWSAWAEQGMEQLHPNTFEDLFDRAVAHLEAACTP
jgi:hypothetical protein